MRILASLLLLALLALSVHASLSPKMAKLKEYYEGRLPHLAELEEKERKMVETVGQLLAEVEAGKISTRAAVAPRQQGVYSQVELENGDKFGVRQMAKVDFEDVIVNYLDSQCSILACGTIISSVIELILPDLILLQSLNAQAAASTTGQAHLDLLIQLLTFPGSSSTLNSLLDQILGVTVYPTTAVAYFGANAQYDLSFDAAHVDLAAQAFALLQTYTRLIEFNDANGNQLYDDGEELSAINLGSAGWNPTSYAETVTAQNVTVHTVTSSTKDGVVTFECVTSSYPLEDSTNQILSPNATKCTITIEGFPYTGPAASTILALEAYIAVYGAQFSGAASAEITDFSLQVTNTSPGVAGGEFNWVNTVDVSGSSLKVKAVGSAGASDGVIDFATKFILTGAGSATSDSRKIIFSLGGPGRFEKIVWDPSVVYGEPAAKATSAAAGLVPGSLLLVLSALFYLLF